MKKLISFLVMAVMAVIVLGTVGCAAREAHKVVIQVSTADPKVHWLAINNVENLRKVYGPGNVKIELVAYGPGLSLLSRQSKQMQRIEDLAIMDEVKFNACAITMGKIEKKKGKKPKLIDGVKVVPGGLTHIVGLQEQGYAYIRP